MPLKVIFVSGPRRSGKSVVVQQMISDCFPDPPHYLRLTSESGDKSRPIVDSTPRQDCGVATADWVSYSEDRVFEFLPDVLRRIHRRDRRGAVIIEADADPLLRHAYPYDHRVFVIPAPQRRSEIFRTGMQAAEAFRNAMEDTAAFAGEIYGLIDDNEETDFGGHESRSALTATQLRGLMNSPLGDELATRILLQPAYHGLMESDVLVVNTGIGGVTEVLDESVSRLEKVLKHVHGGDGRGLALFPCDPADRGDPLRDQLIRRVRALITGASTDNACDASDDDEDL